MSARKLNIELLQKVKDHILAEPKRLDMGSFIDRAGDRAVTPADYYPKCGTVGCIAGWAVTLSTDDKLRYDQIEGKARELLGLSPEQAAILFYDADWPEEFMERLCGTEPQTPEHAQITAERIDHFIATRGAE